MTLEIDSSTLNRLVRTLERRSTRFWAGTAFVLIMGGVAMATAFGAMASPSGGLVALGVSAGFSVALFYLARVVVQLARTVADAQARQVLQAVDDDLTGLSNRRHFLMLAERELSLIHI